MKLKTGLPDRELTVPLRFQEEFFLKEPKVFEKTLTIREGETAHVSFSGARCRMPS
ncbi:MAG: hypothetical protein P1U85_00840 [Verrucomicrobiales bacterium]|nr:hypothetical protein [Verrucomicrobiales bacterium]